MIHSLPWSCTLACQRESPGQKGLKKMWIVRLPNGAEIDVSGGLRVLEVETGLYVVGQEMLIPVNSWEEGREQIRKIKQNEC